MFGREYAEADAEGQPAREHTGKAEGGEDAVETGRNTGRGMAKRYLQVKFTPFTPDALLGCLPLTAGFSVLCHTGL